VSFYNKYKIETNQRKKKYSNINNEERERNINFDLEKRNKKIEQNNKKHFYLDNF
jgi:hypothetical protein